MARRLDQGQFQAKNQTKYQKVRDKKAYLRSRSDWQLKNRYESDDSSIRDYQEQIMERNFTSADAENIALNNPSYVFSTRASFDHFKNNYAAPIAKSSIESLKNSDLLKHMNQILKEIKVIEANKAVEVCKDLELKIEGSPERTVKKLLQDGMNLNSQPLDAEGLITYIFRKEIMAMSSTGLAKVDQTFLRNVKKRQITVLEDTDKVMPEVEKLLEEIESMDLGQVIDGDKNILAPIYDSFRNLKKNIKDADLIQLLKTGKGTLQEMLDFKYINEVLKSLKIINKPNLELVGSLAVKEFVSGLSISAARKVSIAQGKARKGIESDILLNYSKSKLGISVKSTVDLGKQKNKFKYSGANTDYKQNLGTILDKIQNEDSYGEVYKAIRYGLVVLMSSFSLQGEGDPSPYYINDQVLRPLAFAMINQDSFINEFFGKKYFDKKINTVQDMLKDPEFHHILMINNKVFWYSELLETTIEDISDYGSDMYKFLLKVNDFGGLSALGSEARKFYMLKRRTLDHKAIRHNKNYGERLDYLLSNPKILDTLRKYEDAARSVSIKINTTQFRVKVI